MKTKAKPIDNIDKNILRVLQKDARIPYSQLAKEVGLSATPCIERVKRLEADNVIQGYTARINPQVADATLVVLVNIQLVRSSKDVFQKFSDAASLLPEIQECYLVSGDFDYLIKARVADIDAYRKFYGDTLLSLPGVQSCTSYVVMEQVKETLNLYIGK